MNSQQIEIRWENFSGEVAFFSENEERNMVDFFKVVVDNLHLENMCFCGVFCYQKHCLISSQGFSKKTWSTI